MWMQVHENLPDNPWLYQWCHERVVGQAGEEEMEFHQKLSPCQNDLSWVLSGIKCASKVSVNIDLAK